MVLRKGVSQHMSPRMAPFRFKLYFKGLGWVVSVSEATIKKIWDNGTVPRCTSLHKYCALREAPTSVNSQNHSLENMKYFGTGAMTTKMLLEKDERGSVINTNSHQKGTPTKALTSCSPHQSYSLSHCRHQPVHKPAHIRKRMCLNSRRNLTCTRTRGGIAYKWGLETHSQPLSSSGLR